MANTFLIAEGKRVGKSLCEPNLAGTAREILSSAHAGGCEILLPVDAVVAEKLAAHAASRVVQANDVAEEDMILDLGPSSIKHVVSTLDLSKALLWNGRSERSRSSRSTRVLSKLRRQRQNSRGAGSCCRWLAAATPWPPSTPPGSRDVFPSSLRRVVLSSSGSRENHCLASRS